MEYREGTELLLGYVSGSVDTQTSAELEGHIEACLKCEKFVHEQKAVWDALDAFEPEPVSADFNRRLYQRIEQPVTWRDRVSGFWQTVRYWNGLPVAGAAMAAALLVGGIVWQMPSNHVRPSEKAAVQAGVIQPQQLQDALGDMEMLRDLNSVMRADSSAPSKM
jgi:anti-sigma factor RsiW